MGTFWVVPFLLFLHFSRLGLVLVLGLGLSSSSSSTSDLFESWCRLYNKTYPSEERQYRLKVFEDNLAFVNHHNRLGNSSYTLDLNAFADLTQHEFRASKLGLPLSANDLIRLKRRTTPVQLPNRVGDVGIPSSVDWRKEGAVTRVKDQGNCGACWSFSATGAMEGINKITTGSLVSLSEQELIDCDRSFNEGCDGGLMDYAYEFVVQNHGIDTEDDYPFLGKQKTCNRNKLKRRVVTIDGYVDVPPNEEDLLKAVAAQPVSVGICGSERAFQLYSKGVFSGPCSTALDHAVLIVGYGSEHGVDYWIIKNSWGTSWGMNGYMHMLRKSGNGEGVCGINKLASYPTKTSPNPPPPSPPGPTVCNLFSYCAAAETCCCARSFLGLCFSWKCCELNAAVCCKDHKHCCPQGYPICDTARDLCLRRTGNTTAAKAMGGKQSRLRNIVSELPILRI